MGYNFDFADYYRIKAFCRANATWTAVCCFSPEVSENLANTSVECLKCTKIMVFKTYNKDEPAECPPGPPYRVLY